MRPLQSSKTALTSILTSAVVISGLAVFAIADPPETAPNGRGHITREIHSATPNGEAARARTGANGISYHGGPIITNGSHLYYIWYGAWGSNTALTILPKLANGLSGSPYFNINTTYTNSAGQKVANSTVLAGQYTVPTTTHGTSLTDATVQQIVADTINGGHLAYDAQGIYFVLTSAEIKETSGFCTQYCGWHTHFTLNNSDVKYAFVGNSATQCPSSCAAQTTSPNNNPGADGMASVVAHELEEATTDPDLNAWYDTKGNENADKCAWTFGTTQTASNGSKYNMTLGGLQFLIQQNWVNATGGYCALSF